MKTTILRHGITLAVLLSLTAAATVQASERPADGYIMTVYEDMACSYLP